eukprot:c16903_g1_i2 orf=220-2154(-)
MSCLALALQPVHGADILLQTREWFHPARALLASADFRAIRIAQSSGKRDSIDGLDPRLGDEALAASGGQVVVGKESKHRVIYRLVNSIYVLGITSLDHDDLVSNVFECTSIVNQAVSVLVAACKGVDVTTDKLYRKYTEIYMALDVILRGVSTGRLATILASIHGEGIAQLVLSATDAENRARGAESWHQVKGQSVEHLANLEILSSVTFEMPEDTLAAGDEVAATLAPTTPTPATQVVEEAPAQKPSENEDPFAASEKINRPEELAGGFKKSKEPVSNVTSALAELEVPTMAPSTTAESMFIGVEGFEGDYGGLDFGADGAMFGGAFEGLDDAFGGGLDASEFGATPESVAVKKGLGGLEELETGRAGAATVAVSQAPSAAAGGVVPSEQKATIENKWPLIYLSEEIRAEFKGSRLSRLGLQGSLHLKTVLPSASGGQDTEFSFRLDGIAGISKAVMRSAALSSLGKGLFHVRTPPSEDSITVLKYRLHPRLTPVPLRIRLVTCQSGSLISLMIQYVANPYLPDSLKDVLFIVKLPFVPSLLKMSPKGSLNRHSKELRWHIKEIQLQVVPGCLRAQMPLDLEGADSKGEDASAPVSQKLKLQAHVEFSFRGQTLSGISIVPATEGSTDFYVGEHTYKTGSYFC